MARTMVVVAAAPLAAILVAAALALSGGLPGGGSSAFGQPAPGVVWAVGAESQYANVIAQVGGPFVRVTAIVRNPNTDPHDYEASPAVARSVAAAQLIVQNGLGYDSFMSAMESASPSKDRRVIDVQTLLHLPDTTPNPHLWYDPSTMPAVAAAIAHNLSAIDPGHRSFFRRSLRRFDRSLQPWRMALTALRTRFRGTPVATTEPVADYLLQAAGLVDETPFAFQQDVMNGVDPSPQHVSAEESLLRGHVKVFVYNVQVTDSVTESLLGIARAHRVPVVGVYETMPAPGYDYQSWMLAEVRALTAALAYGTSSTRL